VTSAQADGTRGYRCPLPVSPGEATEAISAQALRRPAGAEPLFFEEFHGLRSGLSALPAPVATIPRPFGTQSQQTGKHAQNNLRVPPGAVLAVDEFASRQG
jgi:hypothetical protein